MGPCSSNHRTHSVLDLQLELSHHQARSLDLATYAFKCQASGANFNTEVTPQAFSLGPNPQEVLSKSLKVPVSSGAACELIWPQSAPPELTGGQLKPSLPSTAAVKSKE